ncbi:sigma-70 family RNA polymerase sigma factor [Cytobacillus horneckiae]|uniref:sigma-70 family RNA polymerase sigma factor n=1 Tax=Cytobacillus horneckiae TaxID=549687 RepID=UPI003D9A2DF7
MESFEQLAKQYERMIYKIMRTLHIYQQEEEFFQIGLIALWEAWCKFDGDRGKPFISYAYAYVRGTLLNELTRMSKYEQRNVCLKEEFWKQFEEVACISYDEVSALAYWQSFLTDKQKKWMLYTCLYGFSIREISALENVSVSAVKQWREGARRRLKGKLNIIDG